MPDMMPMNIASEKSWMTGPPNTMSAPVASRQVLPVRIVRARVRFKLRLITS